MLIAAVVELHGDEHRYDPCHSPGKLAKKKGVTGAVALLGNHSRCAEHHDQANKHQTQSDSEQPAIGADTFCHEVPLPKRLSTVGRNKFTVPPIFAAVLPYGLREHIHGNRFVSRFELPITTQTMQVSKGLFLAASSRQEKILSPRPWCK